MGCGKFTEKIDGANYSYATNDGENVLIAKRTSFIGEDSSFFNHQAVDEEMIPKVKELWALIAKGQGKEDGEKFELKIYGELYGSGVQSRVWYGEGRYFSAFDITVRGWFLDTHETVDMCARVGIPHAPVVYPELTFEQAIALDPVFETHLSEPDGNRARIAEGYVLKPIHAMFMPSGARVALKHKNPAFSEVKPPRKERSSNPSQALTDGENAVVAGMVNYLTASRVYAVVSKMGEITKRDFGKMQGLLVQDVIEEYQKDIQAICSDDVVFNMKDVLDKASYKRIMKEITRQAVDIVKPVYLQLI